MSFFRSGTLYLMGKRINTDRAHIGAMFVIREVQWVVLFNPTPGKLKAYELAFEWIKPTLSLVPTIEEGPAEWTSIDDIFEGFVTNAPIGIINRPITFSFDQEAPTSDFSRHRTYEYKEMLRFIKSGLKPSADNKVFFRDTEDTKEFLLAFLNEHKNFEEFSVLLNIIFTLVEHGEIDMDNVVDALAKTENKEALVIVLQKADELKIRRSMNTARWEL